eukprot:m.87508 g.87508  ORF g.87508 m.87508 type:complete len:320 (-) comp12242_c0_seq3:1459-2418(-)
MTGMKIASYLLALVVFVLFAVAVVTGQIADLSDDDDGFVPAEFSTCDFTTSTRDGERVEYDLSPLKVSNRQDVSRFDNYEVNYHVVEKRDDREYDYYLNVCGPLEYVETLNHTTQDTTMAQVGPNRDTYVGGVLHEARFSSLADSDLRYVMGEGANNRETVIFFFCADVGLSHPVFADEPTSLVYFFVWNTCAACPLGSPIRDNCREDPADLCSYFGIPKEHAGTVILIIVVVLFLSYFVFGALYNKFMRGKEGLDVIPNISFWSSCCGAVLTGCGLFCRNNNKTKPSTQYKHLSTALEDDLDSEDLDDDAHEHLVSKD